MLIVRSSSPRSFGPSGHTIRRYLVIEKRYRPRPKIGVRSYVADDLPTLTEPVVFFTRPALLNLDDFEFCDIRAAVAAHYAAGRRLSEAEAKADKESLIGAQLEFGRTWGKCEHIAHQVFNAEPLTIRDLFLRAEMLTMHYGDGQLLDELLEVQDIDQDTS